MQTTSITVVQDLPYGTITTPDGFALIVTDYDDESITVFIDRQEDSRRGNLHRDEQQGRD